jgi:hypothetical protein
MNRVSHLTTALLAVAAAVACSDDPTGPEGQGTVNFQLATTGTGATTGPQLAIEVTRGEDVIVISEVQLVARKIKLEQADGSCPSDIDDESEADDDCPTLRLGPMLLDPPIEEGADATFTVDVPAGTYDELMIQVHKPSNANEDAAFIAANPDFNGVSIRVVGTFNGTPFTFTTDLTQVITVDLDDPVVVEEDGEVGLTLLLDVRSWFLGTGGAVLLNPGSLSVQNRTIVEQNIRQSFHAFQDDDEDGEDDD